MLKGLRQQIQDIPNLLSLKPLKCPNLEIIFFNNEYSSTMNMNSLFNEYEHARIWAVKNDVTLFPTDDLPKHPPKYHCSWPQRDDLILYGTQTCSLNSTQSRMSQKAVIYVMGQFKYINIHFFLPPFKTFIPNRAGFFPTQKKKNTNRIHQSKHDGRWPKAAPDNDDNDLLKLPRNWFWKFFTPAHWPGKRLGNDFWHNNSGCWTESVFFVLRSFRPERPTVCSFGFWSGVQGLSGQFRIVVTTHTNDFLILFGGMFPSYKLPFNRWKIYQVRLVYFYHLHSIDMNQQICPALEMILRDRLKACEILNLVLFLPIHNWSQ